MKKLFLLIFVLSIVISCDNEKYNDDVDLNKTVVSSLEASADYNFESVVKKKPNAKSEVISVNRKFIKNGRVVFKTDSISKTKSRINQFIKQFKGYVSSDNTSKNNTRIYQYLTVRIPAKNFDAFLSELSKGVNEYDSKDITISDVTEQFYDLQSRLKNKKELEKRYLQILGKAKSVKEILEVEKEIGKLREDIESAEGRLKYLSSQIDLSTLTITFYKEIEAKTEKTNRFVEAFNDGILAIKNFGIFLVSIWPFAILISIFYLIVRRKLKKRSS
tara:strand:- start:1479 stop:2303 length:825 start_codon:yes stop_codon:yes gene_type:complete